MMTLFLIFCARYDDVLEVSLRYRLKAWTSYPFMGPFFYIELCLKIVAGCRQRPLIRRQS
uniref:Uncharacterized protein n=1 Tax=Oryza brachyantha TaxID=4533 RepID=J3KWA8_ORYBR